MTSLLLTSSSLWIENVTSLFISQEHYKGTACHFHKMALLTLSLIKNKFLVYPFLSYNPQGHQKQNFFSSCSLSLEVHMYDKEHVNVTERSLWVILPDSKRAHDPLALYCPCSNGQHDQLPFCLQHPWSPHTSTVSYP